MLKAINIPANPPQRTYQTFGATSIPATSSGILAIQVLLYVFGFPRPRDRPWRGRNADCRWFVRCVDQLEFVSVKARRQSLQQALEPNEHSVYGSSLQSPRASSICEVIGLPESSTELYQP